MSSGKRCASSRGTRIDLGQTLGCECVCVCGMGFAFCYGALRQSFPSTDVCVLNHSRNHEFCEKLNSIVLGIL